MMMMMMMTTTMMMIRIMMNKLMLSGWQLATAGGSLATGVPGLFHDARSLLLPPQVERERERQTDRKRERERETDRE